MNLDKRNAKSTQEREIIQKGNKNRVIKGTEETCMDLTALAAEKVIYLDYGVPGQGQ